jgi:hypothetical protein
MMDHEQLHDGEADISRRGFLQGVDCTNAGLPGVGVAKNR